MQLERAANHEVLDPIDVPVRLASLALLQDGWLDGQGVRPSRIGLEWLAQAWAAKWPEQAPVPYAYPTLEGGISLEWDAPGGTIEMVIDFERLTGELCAAGASPPQRFDLRQSVDWQRLAATIQRSYTERRSP